MSQPLDPRAAILSLAEDGELLPLAGIDGAFVRKLSVADMDALADADGHFNARLVVCTVVSAAGEPLFSEADVPALLKLKADSFGPIYRQCAEHNGLTRSLEDAAKN